MANIKETVKLSGFNNLTKILSFNFYDFCIAMNEQQKQEYINYIHTKYCAANISKIARNVCEIIEANILSETVQDYEPVGASTMTLMSDLKGGGSWEQLHTTPSAAVKMHLDKSHITTHTYPDASDPEALKFIFRKVLRVTNHAPQIKNSRNIMIDNLSRIVVFIGYFG